jgi:hypothetical protein
MREKLGNYCLDMSKLIFGGTILSAIVKENLPVFWILSVGSFVVAALAIGGFLLIKK